MKRSKKKKLKEYLTSELVRKIINVICLIFPVVIIGFGLANEEENGTIRDLVFTAGILFVTLFTYISFKTEDKKSEGYDAVREGIERDIIKLQYRLAKTDKQWNSSNHLVLQIQTMANNGFDPAMLELVFLRDLGLKEDDYIIDQNLIFYLSSFSSEYASIHATCKTVCDKVSMNLIRADDIFTTGDVFTQIVKYIVRATLIIVNIDGKNPNVFYELGIAHALGKNVILISKRDNDIPFDIRQNRIILYSNVEELEEVLPKAICQHKELMQVQLSTHPRSQISLGGFPCPSMKGQKDEDMNIERKPARENVHTDGDESE